jgi:8-oxo-dGTP pyrophosphatase MutT (NUDIX family)
MSRASDKIYQQFGALPFVIADDGTVRILLVTTRGRRDWIIPKGWPIPNLSGGETAAREAYEEAGVVGTLIGEAPIGTFRYKKQRDSGRMAVHEVTVFLLAVERQLRKWPEKAERRTRWFALEEATELVERSGLSDLLRDSAAGLQQMATQAVDGQATVSAV